MPSRLALGTAQFGMSYGITNRSGQVRADEAGEILRAACEAGIDTLDTAIAYGESEHLLGCIGVKDWRVITKIGEPPVDHDSGWVRSAVLASLQRLRIERLGGLLLHRPETLHGERGRQLWSELTALRDEGVIEKIGVSIYDPDELAPIAAEYPLDLVQAPFNILDRRLFTSGWLERLKAAGSEVHARSIYLQGLLLLEPEALPVRFDAWRPLWRRWHGWLASRGFTPLEGCIGFALAQPLIDCIVIGTENAMQLRQAVAAANTLILDFPDDLVSTDLDLISPVRWRTA
jgi:aryl-alcohol dehydrogenase-like predicted oxidoreductase